MLALFALVVYKKDFCERHLNASGPWETFCLVVVLGLRLKPYPTLSITDGNVADLWHPTNLTGSLRTQMPVGAVHCKRQMMSMIQIGPPHLEAKTID